MKTNAPPATKRATQLAEARKETELLLKRAQIQYERWYNRGRTRKEFVEGDVVLFFIYKEHQATKAQCETVRYFGPFPVLNVIGDSKLAYDWICPSGFACTTSSSSPPWSRRRADLATPRNENTSTLNKTTPVTKWKQFLTIRAPGRIDFT